MIIRLLFLLWPYVVFLAVPSTTSIPFYFDSSPPSGITLVTSRVFDAVCLSDDAVGRERLFHTPMYLRTTAGLPGRTNYMNTADGNAGLSVM